MTIEAVGRNVEAVGESFCCERGGSEIVDGQRATSLPFGYVLVCLDIRNMHDMCCSMQLLTTMFGACVLDYHCFSCSFISFTTQEPVTISEP